MAARTTHKSVEAILAENYHNAVDLQPFVDAAAAVVDDVAAYATSKGAPLASERLELVERWLAAHMYTVADPTYSSKSTGGSSGAFHGQTGLNLDGSRYGQTAKLLDSSGGLKALEARATARVTWLGRPLCQE